MLTAKVELQQYADSLDLEYKVGTTLAKLISRITAEEAEAVLTLLKEAEAVAGERH